MSINRHSFLFPIPLIALGIALVTLGGCRTSKSLATSDAELKPRQSNYLLKRLQEHRVRAEWLSARAKVVFRDEEQTRHFVSYVRVRRDSVIWMNFKKSGIEAGRLLVRPDSVFLIDRLNNQFAEGSLSDLKDRLRLPFKDLTNDQLFNSLQEAFFGNPVFFRVKSLNTDTLQGMYAMNGQANGLKSEYVLSAASFLLREMTFTNLADNRKASFQFDRFSTEDGVGNFAYFRHIAFHEPQTGGVSLELEFKQVELDVPKAIQFHIPDHYQRME